MTATKVTIKKTAIFLFKQYVAFVSLSANSILSMQLTFVSIWWKEKENNNNKLNEITIYGWKPFSRSRYQTNK